MLFSDPDIALAASTQGLSDIEEEGLPTNRFHHLTCRNAWMDKYAAHRSGLALCVPRRPARPVPASTSLKNYGQPLRAEWCQRTECAVARLPPRPPLRSKGAAMGPGALRRSSATSSALATTCRRCRLPPREHRLRGPPTRPPPPISSPSTAICRRRRRDSDDSASEGSAQLDAAPSPACGGSGGRAPRRRGRRYGNTTTLVVAARALATLSPPPPRSPRPGPTTAADDGCSSSARCASPSAPTAAQSGHGRVRRSAPRREHAAVRRGVQTIAHSAVERPRPPCRRRGFGGGRARAEADGVSAAARLATAAGRDVWAAGCGTRFSLTRGGHHAATPTSAG